MHLLQRAVQHDVLEAVGADEADRVELVGGDAVDLHQRLLPVPHLGQPERRVAHPQLRRPAHADDVVAHGHPEGDLGVLHRGAAEEAERVEDAAVLRQPLQPLARRVVQLHVRAEDGQVGLLGEERRVVLAEDVDRAALVELEVGRALGALGGRRLRPQRQRQRLRNPARLRRFGGRSRLGECIEPLRRHGRGEGRRVARGRGVAVGGAARTWARCQAREPDRPRHQPEEDACKETAHLRRSSLTVPRPSSPMTHSE